MNSEHYDVSEVPHSRSSAAGPPALFQLCTTVCPLSGMTGSALRFSHWVLQHLADHVVNEVQIGVQVRLSADQATRQSQAHRKAYKFPLALTGKSSGSGLGEVSGRQADSLGLSCS